MRCTQTPLLDGPDAGAKRQEILAYFRATWADYESLFELLADESAYYLRPEPLRHPLIFYYGHTATFFINKLRVAGLIDQRLDPQMESILAIGVDEMSWDDLDEKHYDWPSVAAVRDYRQRVKALVEQLIEKLPLQLPVGWDDPFWILLMGIEHERIHLETSSVLIRQLPLDKVKASADWPLCPLAQSQRPTTIQNPLLAVTGATIQLGRSHPSATYGWDNEYGNHEETVSDFHASEHLVSNSEFMAFVEDRGYENPQWWTPEGWRWCEYQKSQGRGQHPLFWRRNESGPWRYRALAEEIPMPWDWPVDVNYLEAKAYANWLADKTGQPLRLPTEAEWRRLYDLSLESHYPHWPCDNTPANINLAHWASSCPVTHFRHGDFFDVVGNVWQWTETAINGFEGFQVHPAYDDFSVPTFDGLHNLIMGGSWIATGNEAHRDARYAFRRHFYQHAGFRLVASEQPVVQAFNSYESDELIAQYLEFHYGDEYFGVPNFPARCVRAIEKHLTALPDQKRQRALDIGCAVGRSAFELARHFQQVDAIDFSTRFIRNAIALQEKGQVRYLVPVEGELTELKTVGLGALGMAATASRVHFSQGDACNLKPQFTNYDLVFAGNLIDRLYEPEKFLQDIVERLNPGGLLVLTSPYTWLEEFTPRENWLGGKKVNGENQTTLAALTAILSKWCDPVGAPQDIPFVIRETARKHQHTVAQMTCWRKR
jgi:5-histidylcysteine sulfoxide synthase/putative 4-mercaptohistidine N1-methyltranferase